MADSCDSSIVESPDWIPTQVNALMSHSEYGSSGLSFDGSIYPRGAAYGDTSYEDELSLDRELHSIPTYIPESSFIRSTTSSRLQKLEEENELLKGNMEELKKENELLRKDVERLKNCDSGFGSLGLAEDVEKIKNFFQGVFDQKTPFNGSSQQFEVLKDDVNIMINRLNNEFQAHERRCEDSAKSMQSQISLIKNCCRDLVDSVRGCILQNNQRDQFNSTQLSKYQGMLNQHDAQLQDAAVKQSAADESLTSLSRDLEQTRVDLTERVDQTEQVVNRLADDVSTDRSTSCHNFRELRENGYLIDYAAGHPEDAGG